MQKLFEEANILTEANKSFQQVVKEINKMFPPENSKYPVAFLGYDGKAHVTSESLSTIPGGYVVDYYGEFRGGYPWVHPDLDKYLKKNGFYYEWENPAGIVIYED